MLAEDTVTVKVVSVDWLAVNVSLPEIPSPEVSRVNVALLTVGIVGVLVKLA